VESGVPNRYNDSIAHLDADFAPDQWAEGTVYRYPGYDGSPGSHEVELLLRFEISPHFARGYEVIWGVSGYLGVVRWNGPLADYTVLFTIDSPGIGVAQDGDVLRAEITGNVIVVKKNGAQVATIDVTSVGGTVWATGQPGIGFWPVDGATIDAYGWTEFRAGTLP
jgi:hypothetical protein